MAQLASKRCGRCLTTSLQTRFGMLGDIQQTFYGEYDAIDGYPDIDSPYRMHDDHLGCDICEISGLPLRDEDETVEWGDGEALACLAKNAR